MPTTKNETGRWYEATRRYDGRRTFVRRVTVNKADADAAGSPTCDMVEVWSEGNYPHIITTEAARYNFALVGPAADQRGIECRRNYEMSH